MKERWNRLLIDGCKSDPAEDSGSQWEAGRRLFLKGGPWSSRQRVCVDLSAEERHESAFLIQSGDTSTHECGAFTGVSASFKFYITFDASVKRN